jgi:hypothetical protein
MSNKFPKTITQTLYLHAEESSPTHLQLSAMSMSEYGLCYGTVDVTVDVPENLPDPTEACIEKLRFERYCVQWKARDAVAEIDDKIDRLQAVTYDIEVSK